MKIKTQEAEALFNILQTLAKTTKGVTGYAIARNMRVLNTELTEYLSMKQELFKTYGEQDGDRLYIDRNSPKYPEFEKKLSKLDNITLDIELMKVDKDDIVESELTGEQIYLIYDYLIQEA